MRFVRQLAPLAVFFVILGALGGAAPAFGNVESLSPVSAGNTITITATYTNNPAGAGATLSAAGNGNFSAATASGGQGVSATGVGTKEIKTSADSSGSTGNMITISATFACAGNGPVSFLLLQVGAQPSNRTASANCTGTTTAGTPTTGGNTGLTFANPNNSGRSSPVSIAISPEVIPCGGTASINVTSSLVANAPVQDGTVVNLYTTNGVIEPKIGVIKDGKFVTTLKAPNSAGTATVNASVGSVTNYMDVKFDCGISTSSIPSVASTPSVQSITAAPPPPPPPPAAFPTGGIPIISPPSTGDAGLKALLSE